MINKLLASFSKDSFNDSNVIINWNPLKRCILMLILAGGLNILWLMWKTYIIFTPSLHPFVDLALVKAMISMNCFFIFILFSLIYPCYILQKNPKAEKILPYFCVAIFVITLLYDGYMVGIMSPATLCGMISVISVGLVLFNTKLVYSMLIPSVAIMVYSVYASTLGVMQYAPIFNLAAMDHQPYLNHFWLMSMLYFITPIAVSCFLVFDIILHQWRKREAMFQNLSQIDPLTHLLNRRSINEYLMSSQSEENLQHQYRCIILMDIDHFKKINDQYGHLKGDEVLSKVAQILQEHTRTEDLVGRYGGEEFIMIINSDDQQLAEHIAERCRTAIMDMRFTASESIFSVTASFGISFWDSYANPIQDILNQADLAMYSAKQAGRNQVKIAV